MTVRELVALLSRHDPDSLVICDARSEALLVIGVRPGMNQSWSDTEPMRLTVEDEGFLCAMHIRNPR